MCYWKPQKGKKFTVQIDAALPNDTPQSEITSTSLAVNTSLQTTLDEDFECESALSTVEPTLLLETAASLDNTDQNYSDET